MHLREYRELHKLSQKEVGDSLDPPASAGLVSQWECGVTRVTLDYALQIDRHTDQKVTPQDCAAMYIEPHLRANQQEKVSP
jgi:DNA-binding transcriptional regulator YdaS (Cro superfamily)